MNRDQQKRSIRRFVIVWTSLVSVAAASTGFADTGAAQHQAPGRTMAQQACLTRRYGLRRTIPSTRS